MMSAPRMTPLAMPISVPMPETSPVRTPVGDHRGGVLGGRPGVVQRGLVDAERVGWSAASSSAASVDGADLVRLVGHAADGRDDDAGHQDEQTEDDQRRRRGWA